MLVANPHCLWRWGFLILIYDKPFKTYQEQIQHLIDDYGLVINDLPFAEHALKTISYYDLINGYQDVLMINGRYKDNISIEFLYTFYLFDKSFQNIIFSRVIFIENYFKSVLAHCIAENFGVHHDNYLDDTNYCCTSRAVDFSKLKVNIKEIYTQDHPPDPTGFYKKEHNHIPPWILLKNISFGNSINLFRVLKKPQKNAVANELIPSTAIKQSEKIEFIIAGLNLLRKCRNTIAHNLRFVTFRGSDKDALKKRALTVLLPQTLTVTNTSYPHLTNKDLYSVILFIYCVLNTAYLRSTFLSDIIQHINVPMGEPQLFGPYADITSLPSDLLTRCRDTLSNLQA